MSWVCSNCGLYGRHDLCAVSVEVEDRETGWSGVTVCGCDVCMAVAEREAAEEEEQRLH